MKDYELGDLVEVVKGGMSSPMPKGSVGLVTKIMDSATDDTRYIVMFSERDTFLYYHDELVKP